MERIGPWLRHNWWVFVLLAISLVGSLKRGEQDHAEPTLVTGVLVVAAVLPLFWREQWPELGVLVNAVAVAAYFAGTYADGPIYLSVLFATFALTSRRPPRDWLPYAGAALVAILAGLIVREVRVDASSTLGSLGWATWFVAVDSAAAALGLAVRNRRETRAEQTRRTATEEQLRMAQDLHDGVGHGLAVIAMQAGVALHVLDQDPAAARRSLEAIRDTSKESLDALRAELVRLSPEQGAPAPRSPRNGLADLEVLADRVRAGGIQVVVDAEEVAVEPTVDAVAHTVVQEALTNVLWHAEASTAWVTVRLTDAGLEIVVTDDGRGVTESTAASADRQRMGIPGMRARVEALGGTLTAGPGPERGFVVRAVLPIRTTTDEARA